MTVYAIIVFGPLAIIIALAFVACLVERISYLCEGE
jgi:hypothetical protein